MIALDDSEQTGGVNMAYGDPIATLSTYGDQLLCLRCSIFAHTHMGERKGHAFFFWFRDEVSVEEIQATIGRTEEEAFALEVARDTIRDGLSADPTNRLKLLREGQDQTWFTHHDRTPVYCDTCLVKLESLCSDYP